MASNRETEFDNYEEAEEWEEENDNDSWDQPDSSSEEESQYELSEDEEQTKPNDSVENAIEGDFDRLIHNIKEGKSKNNASSSIWDISIGEVEGFDLHAELRSTSGIGKRRRRQGPRDQPILSQQVRSLIGDANAAYVSQNIPETIRLMEEVIRIEPRESSSWTTLALCYADLGQPEKALKLNIIGAHLFHDVDKWTALGKQSKEFGYFQQALYCFRKACSLSPHDVNAQWERAAVAKELGDVRTAKSSLLSILKRYPHDVGALEELRPVLVELSEIPFGLELYQNAFDFYQTNYPSGQALDSAGDEIPGGGFNQMHIIVLADFYNSVHNPEKAIHTVRRGTRWLQGRMDQRFWDNESDDREFDTPGYIRQDSSDLDKVYYPLDINLRHRLAIARFMLGDHEEGKMHSSVILKNDIKEHAVLFKEIADAMFFRQLYQDALSIYEDLSADETTSSFEVVFRAAECQRNLGYLKEACEIYQHIISGDPDNVEAKMKLAELYEAMDEPRKALNLVYEVIDARKRGVIRDDHVTDVNVSASVSDSLFVEKGKAKAKKVKRGMPLAELQALELQHEAATKAAFEELKILTSRIEAGEKQAEDAWLVEAEKLVESFREVKPLFPSTRIEFRGMPAWRRGQKKVSENAEENMVSRLELGIEYEKKTKKKPGKVTQFRCISFDDWLHLFIKYGFFLTQRNQYPLAEEVLRHAMQSVVFQEPEMADSLRIALAACAIHVKAYDTVVTMCRKLINSHQFNNGPIRLLLACLASGMLSVNAFIDPRLQKHLSREVRLSHAVVEGKEVKWNQHVRRYHLTAIDEGNKDEEEDHEDMSAGPSSIPDKPTKHNPILVCIYGQLCVAAKSYQSAIFYLLHAYEYQPNDPVICLSLAIAYLGRAMQRQADNRHYMIAESLAFLSQYRAIRSEHDTNMDEIEFNFGRLFHQIGLFHYAKIHYERVLKSTEDSRKSNPLYVGLSREAAYNLSLIYMGTGAIHLAKDLYRQWLSI